MTILSFSQTQNAGKGALVIRGPNKGWLESNC